MTKPISSDQAISIQPVAIADENDAVERAYKSALAHGADFLPPWPQDAPDAALARQSAPDAKGPLDPVRVALGAIDASYPEPPVTGPAVVYVDPVTLLCVRTKPAEATRLVAYYPRAEHDALHERLCLAEASLFSANADRARLVAERDAALAALRDVVEAWDTACAGCHEGGHCFNQRRPTDITCTYALDQSRSILAQRDGER
jgi:hypothetical protein